MMQSEKSSQWYLAATKPKEEKRALENLEMQGIGAYLPTVSVERIRRGKRVELDEVMFPGYIFIQLNSALENVGKIRSTRGIRDWVRFEGKPAKVASEIIASIQASNNTEQPNRVLSNMPNKGDRVSIKSGPFASLTAIFQASDGLERSVLLLDFLGKQQLLSVENKDIEKL